MFSVTHSPLMTVDALAGPSPRLSGEVLPASSSSADSKYAEVYTVSNRTRHGPESMWSRYPLGDDPYRFPSPIAQNNTATHHSDSHPESTIQVSSRHLSALIESVLNSNPSASIPASLMALYSPPSPDPHLTLNSPDSVTPRTITSTQQDMTLSKATATRTTRIRRTSTLILHECTHPECSHTASRRNNLIAHMKTHSRDRPRNFICKYHGCGRAFLRSGDLQRHGGSHDVDSWSTCFGCGRTFSRLDSLKRHQTNTQKSVCALAGNT